MTDSTPPTATATVSFRWAIAYVSDVARTTAFYQQAFGFAARFADPGGQYAELDTGATILAFTAHDLAAANLPDGYTRHDLTAPPLAVELAFTTHDVAATVQAAVAAGGHLLKEPTLKPWGQTRRLRPRPDGVLLEIATPLP